MASDSVGAGETSQRFEARLQRFRAHPQTEAGTRLAQELMAAGRGAEALEVVRLLLATSPDHPQLLLLEGRAFVLEGFLEHAQMSFIRASRAAPRDPAGLIHLGDVLMKRGDPSRAEKVLEKALQLQPSNREAALLLDRARRLARLASAPFEEPVDALEDTAEIDNEPTQMRQLGDMSRSLVNSLVSGERPIDRSRSEGESWGEDPDTAISAPPEALRDSLEQQQQAVRVPAAPKALGAPQRSPAGHKSAPNPNARPAQAKPFGATVGYEEPTEARGVTIDLESARRSSPAPSREIDPAETEAAILRAEQQAIEEMRRDERAREERARQEREGRRESREREDQRAREAERARAREALRLEEEARARESLRAHEEAVAREEQLARDSMPAEPVVAAPTVAKPLDVSDVAPPSLEQAFESHPGLTPPPVPRPDLPIGQEAGATEDIDRNLAVLEELGIFESPNAAPRAATGNIEIERAGTRMGYALLAFWAFALVLTGGGYFGWQQWIAHRHAEATRLVEWSQNETRAGLHKGLVGAERQLLAARELAPRRSDILTSLLFVHMQRSFEDGAFEPGYLRRTIARAQQVDASPVYIAASEAIILAADGDVPAGLTKMRAAVQTAPQDPNILYVAGRFEQRLGEEGALAHIEAAHRRDPQLVAATLAVAEARIAAGQKDQALALVGEVLARQHDHLRATLYKAFWTSDTTDPAAGIAALDALTAALEHGAPVDQVLTRITRARLLLRQGKRAEAGAAVEEAYRIGVTEPRVLAWIASEALATGKLEIARQAGTRSAGGAPTNLEFRKTFAGVLLALRDGESVLQSLRAAPDADPEIAILRARAALLAHNREAMEALTPGLDALAPTNPVAAALKVRFDVARGAAAEALPAARALASANPTVRETHVALADAALATEDAATAITSLQEALRLDPNEPEAHYMLAGARRTLGDADGAEQALRAAIAILPDYADAQASLGALLLQRGRYADADQLFTRLASRVGDAQGIPAALAGRLGRIEALIGLGRVDDARVQLDAIQDADRQSDRAKLTIARLHITAGEGTAASEILRPMSQADGAPATTFALLGDAYLVINRRDDADEAYSAALERDSELPQALVGKAMVAVERGDEREAIELAERARVSLSERVAPPALRARMMIALGRAQAGQNELAEAKDQLLRATQVEGAPADAFFWLAEVLRDRHDPAAPAAYQRYLEMAPQGQYADRARRATRSRR